MKKKLLFVIESLSIGGAEKSLVTLLNLIDYSQFDVDLLLFSQGGAFQRLLPAPVHLLPIPDYFQYTQIGWKQLSKKFAHPKSMVSQLSYSIGLRCKKMNHIEKAVLLWKSCATCINGPESNYDVAIAYAQGVPTFFVMDKVSAKKKAAWINVTYRPTGKELEFIKPYYEKYDVVNAVSESVREQMQETFGIPDAKVMVMKDILDTEFAYKMAALPSDVQKDMAYEGTKILTVGRLAAMKGHDLAIAAAAILKQKGFSFRWYVIGNGALKEQLAEQIRKNGLEDWFILLGSRTNPYPYYAACDLYVQTSRFEGFGITLAEAKMFRKPIVTTNFDSVGAQFVNEVNGLIVDISAEAIANGILRMVEDDALRERCVTNLKAENISNAEELNKLYAMLNEG